MKRLITLLLALAGLAALLGGCGDGGQSPQERALQRLKEDSADAVLVRIEDGVARSLQARIPIPASVGDDPEVKARFFLDSYRDLYGLRDIASELAFTEVLRTPDALPIGIELRIPPRSAPAVRRDKMLPERPMVPVRL